MPKPKRSQRVRMTVARPDEGGSAVIDTEVDCNEYTNVEADVRCRNGKVVLLFTLTLPDGGSITRQFETDLPC